MASISLAQQWAFYRQAACGVLPILAVALASWISVSHQRIPDCQLFIDGCVSVSRAVRAPESIGLFRALMGIAIVAQWHFWFSITRRDARCTAAQWSGLGATIALLLYVFALGHDGDWYQFLRRFGVTIYFGGTLFAQLWVYRSIHVRQGFTLRSVLWWLTLLPYLLGLAHVITKLSLDSATWENRFEWWIATLMSLWYVAYAQHIVRQKPNDRRE